MNADQFMRGDLVLYIPKYANGNGQHPDCERGIVTSTDDKYVLVRYRGMAASQATDPCDLKLIERPERTALNPRAAWPFPERKK